MTRNSPHTKDALEGAAWLRDPIFEGVPIVNVFQKEKAAKPKLAGPKNVHTYFRTEIDLPSQPIQAELAVTADDYCKLYVNGAFVVQGPESGYPWHYPYYVLDVARFLRPGKNCLASHVFYQGLFNRVWTSADNRSGFLLSLRVTFEDGATARFVTDDTWRCFASRTFPTHGMVGYDTQFAEDIDMREEPVGWREAGFDDAAWGTPLRGAQDHAFALAATPPLEHVRVEPIIAKDKGNGNYFYDFGTEIVGHTRIRLRGEAGHKIEVRHGEELSAPDAVRYEMRANCTYQEFPVLSGKDDLIAFYDYRAFRYIEILDAPARPEVWVDVRHHRFDPHASRFDASDELLPRIWQLCKNGVRYGSQGGFLDCPSREKGQYLGDALITSHSHLLLTADATLTKKAIEDFQLSQRICPGIMAVAPSSFNQEIAEYSLQWTMMLRNYYWLTGDRAFVEQMVEAAFRPLFAYFVRFQGASGLLSGMKEKWVLVDWPKNLRDGYDYEYAEGRENTVLNAFYYASLRAAAELLRELGKDSTPYEAEAERVKQAFAERLLDTETGLFVDAPGSTHSSLHANALPLCFGLVAPENVPKVVGLIREKRLSCGVYIAPFVIVACYRAGEPDLGYALLTSREEHSWHEMLKHGATTCMEAWGPDQKWNTSWCHPWSSGPVFLIAECLMGLMPAEPGWRKIRFAPNIPDALDEAMIALPIPQGWVSARYEKNAGCMVTAPPGVEVLTATDAPAPIEVRHAVSHAKGALRAEQRAYLAGLGWDERVGEGLGVWVSVDEQTLRIIRGGELIWQAACSTAAKGVGAQMDSYKTPPGWHAIAEKVGEGAPWGQVFRSRQPTEMVWRPGESTPEDLVLTRILVLAGEEAGKNKGGNVDSRARNIYVHGTNAEQDIGTPASCGCIRLTNDDVIAAFDRIAPGTLVLVTQTTPPAQ